jgi:DNA modification methylase
LIEPIILASCPEGGVVFDPFGGSGTVALVSKQHKRHFVLSEINTDIAALAQKRVSDGVTSNDKKRLSKQKHLPLQEQEPLPEIFTALNVSDLVLQTTK